MVKTFIFGVVISLFLFSFFAGGAAVAETDASSQMTISQLQEMIRVLTDQVRVLQAQVQARLAVVTVPSVSQYRITVETVPVTPEAAVRLDSFDAPLNTQAGLPYPPEVPQIQSSRPQVVVQSQKALETWRVGSDFAVSWQVSGFGKPSLNMKEVEVVLYDASGINPLGFLCKRCGTDMVGLHGNEGSVTGRVGTVTTEELKLAKIQPGYYRVQVRLVSDPTIASMSEGSVSVLMPSGSQNLVPSIVSIGYPDNIRAKEYVSFKVQAYDPDGATLSYKMKPGDGLLFNEYLTGAAASDSFSGTFAYRYSVPGTYEVVFVVTDERGAAARASQYLTVH